MYIELLTLFIVLSSLFLGLITFYKNHKSATHRLFLLLTIVISLWAITNYFSLQILPLEKVLFWIRLVMTVTAAMFPVLFLLAKAFPSPNLNVPKWKLIIIIILTIFIQSLALSPLVFVNIEMVKGQVSPVPGMGMPLFGLHIIGFFGLTLVTLYKKSKILKGLERTQFSFLNFGIALTFLLAIITNFVFVNILKMTNFVAFGPVFTLILIGSIFYAIVKHRFLDIRLIIARSISYALLSLIIIVFYTASLFIISNLLFTTPFGTNQLVVSILLSLVIAYTFQPIRTWLEKATEKLFFKENYDPQNLLSKISITMGTTLGIKNLANRVIEQILETMHLEFIYLFLIKDKDLIVVTELGNGEMLHQLSYKQYQEYLEHRHSMLIFDELKEGNLKKIMRDNNFGAFVPLKVKGEAIGLLALGNRKSGEMYTNNDLKLFTILAPQMAIAIQNSARFEEIQQFSEKLKIKIKEATHQIENANQKLREMDKRKDEFLSVAAHELRAPLTAVKGYLSMIIDGDAGKISPKVSEFLCGALEGAEREVRLVNNMLNVSRIEEGRLVYQMGKINLAKVVKDTFNEFKSDAETKKLDYKIHIEEHIKDEVYVDQDRIHEVVANLISNALKYTDQGGVEVKLDNLNHHIRFEVIDTGYGMTTDETKNMFAKFYRANSSAGKVLGTGLGLYITKLLIEKFGGTIGVDSEQGKGSKFWFELPVTRPR